MPINSGKSSVSYNVKGRYARLLPIPVFQCEFGGRVVVTVVINRNGAVQRASVLEADSDADECLHEFTALIGKLFGFFTPVLENRTIHISIQLVITLQVLAVPHTIKHLIIFIKRLPQSLSQFEQLSAYIKSDEFRKNREFLLNKKRYFTTDDYKLLCEFKELKKRPDIVRYFSLIAYRSHLHTLRAILHNLHMRRIRIAAHPETLLHRRTG